MEMALRRRLDGVDEIAISQRDQRVTVTFVPGTSVFSLEAFRAAVAEADVTVITLDVRVCGFVGRDGALHLVAGRHEPLVRLRGDVRSGSSICATGRLDDRAHPDEIDVSSVQPRG